VAEARREGRKDVPVLLSHSGRRLFLPLKVAPGRGED